MYSASPQRKQGSTFSLCRHLPAPVRVLSTPFYSSFSFHYRYLQGMLIKEIKVHHIIPQVHMVLTYSDKNIIKRRGLWLSAQGCTMEFCSFTHILKGGLGLNVLCRKSSIMVRSGPHLSVGTIVTL